jgi:hypothetical protein
MGQIADVFTSNDPNMVKMRSSMVEVVFHVPTISICLYKQKFRFDVLCLVNVWLMIGKPPTLAQLKRR